MNKITQYRPAFFEGFENEVSEFSSIKDLLSISWITNWTSIPGFYRFSKSDNCLMGEFEEGKKWWVVGMIENPEEVDLPEWGPQSREST